MWKIEKLIGTLTIHICMQLINGKTLFDVFQLKTPTDDGLRNNLIDWIGKYPGIDVERFNNEEINLIIPDIYLSSFWKFGIFKNGTDLLQRKLINNSFHHNYITKTENKPSTVRNDNGVRELMERKKGHLHINFNERLSYQKIVSFLRNFASRFPKDVKLKPLAKTAKNQYIYMITIFGKGINYKNGVFLHAGVQGREWISVLVVLYLIQEIVENSHSHPGIINLTWYIIPVVNPDGYRYAYRHSKTNIWHSKNRNCSQSCEYGECGVDIFRNFRWKFQGKGSSTQPCSSFYAGEKPFSEVESKVLRHVLIKNKEFLKLYIGIHGHEGFIGYPWGFNNKPCKDYKELEQVAILAANLMRAESINLTDYKIGNLGSITYPSAGNPFDYAKHIRIKYTYVLNMQKPPINHQILPLVKETFIGIKAMATAIYIKHLPPKQNLRTIKRKRRLLEPNNIGTKIKITSSFLFTWHLITTFVR